MMGEYNPSEPFAPLIKHLKEGREYAISGGQKITNNMMVTKGITLLAQTVIFNDHIK